MLTFSWDEINNSYDVIDHYEDNSSEVIGIICVFENRISFCPSYSPEWDFFLTASDLQEIAAFMLKEEVICSFTPKSY